MSAVLRVVACGSVDDGKSTLIGRLLADTDSVSVDDLEHARRVRRGGSVVPAGEIDYSLLTDGLEAEHDQGITIDVAYRYLTLPDGRRVVIADAPGHDQYGANMAVGASTATVAILLVDAVLGVRPATCRHLAVCTTMGVRSVVVAVNKLDALDYDRAVYDRLADQLRALGTRLGVTDLRIIPVSAIRGDNVTTPSPNLPWHQGPTLLGALTDWRPAPERRPVGARVPVQYVVRAHRFRGLAGTVTGGTLRPGDAVRVADGASDTTVQRLLGPDGDLEHAAAGTPVTVVLADDVDVRRGDLLVTQTATPSAPATTLRATLVWTGAEPLRVGGDYLLLAGPRTVAATVTALHGRLDVTSGRDQAADALAVNEIGTVEVRTAVPLPLSTYANDRDTGCFLLVHRRTRDTVAAGLVREINRCAGVVPQPYAVDRSARERLKGQRGRVLWLTGLPSSGKSTIADALERRLNQRGAHTYVLDGDNVRGGLNRDLGFAPAERTENVRRVAEVSALLLDAGLIVIVALVSPFRADRAAARALFTPGDFIEVWVDTPLAECVRRDPKNLYARANAGHLDTMTGIGQNYEPPEAAEIVLDGTEPTDTAVTRLLPFITSD